MKNALVIMIGISEYEKPYSSLPSVKNKDILNFESIFENELNFKFVCNKNNSMTMKELFEYLDVQIINDLKLHQNIVGYDGIIIIFCGNGKYGKNGEEIVTSDGLSISIADIALKFNSEHLKSFADLPKILIIDMYMYMYNNNNNNNNNIIDYKNDQILDNFNAETFIHQNYEFVKIWSISKEQKLLNHSLLSQYWKQMKSQDYCEWTLFELVVMLNKEISKLFGFNSCCVEIISSAPYIIAFQKKILEFITLFFVCFFSLFVRYN